MGIAAGFQLQPSAKRAHTLSSCCSSSLCLSQQEQAFGWPGKCEPAARSTLCPRFVESEKKAKLAYVDQLHNCKRAAKCLLYRPIATRA